LKSSIVGYEKKSNSTILGADQVYHYKGEYSNSRLTFKYRRGRVWRERKKSPKNATNEKLHVVERGLRVKEKESHGRERLRPYIGGKEKE